MSVVVPCHNAARWIGATLDCLRAQTWRRLEVIVVDDGSADGSAEAVGAAAPLGEGRELRLIRQAHQGVSAARNRGTRESRGEFLVYLDADDVLHPWAIERFAERLRADEGTSYVIAAVDKVDEVGRLTSDHRHFYPKEDTAEPLFMRFWLVHGACYRRWVVAAAGAWDETLRVNEDHEFEWRVKVVAGHGPLLEEAVGFYRQHSAAQLHREAVAGRYFPVVLESLGRFEGWLRETGRLDAAMRLRLAHHHRFLGTQMAKSAEARPRRKEAYEAASRLCRGMAHPLRWTRWLALVDSPALVAPISHLRWWWRSRRRANPAVAETGMRARREGGGRVLVVSPVTPREEGIGPERRVWAIIEALATAHQVSLLVVPSRLFRDAAPPAPDYLGGRWCWSPPEERATGRWERGFARRFPRLWSGWSGRPAQWQDLDRRRLARVGALGGMRSFHAVLAFRLTGARCAMALRETLAPGARWWLDLDEMDSLTLGRIAELHAMRGEAAEAARGRADARAYDRAERRLLPGFERIFVSNEADAARLRARGLVADLLPNPAPGLGAAGRARGRDGAREPGAAGGRARALFIGSLGYPPNRYAVEWWLREVAGRAGGWRLVVAGRGAPAELRAMIGAAGEAAEWLGEVARSGEAFAGVDALVAPIQTGGGTRVKILEAWARGVPVVSTTAGIDGLGAEPGVDHLRADTAEEFVAALERLRTEPGLAGRLAAAGRGRAERMHGGEALAAVLRAAWKADVLTGEP